MLDLYQTVSPSLFHDVISYVSPRKWLGVLAEELSVRMLRDAKENHRQPHSLHLYYRSGLSWQTSDHSKSCSMPHMVTHFLSSTCFSASRAAAHKRQGGLLSMRKEQQHHIPSVEQKGDTLYDAELKVDCASAQEQVVCDMMECTEVVPSNEDKIHGDRDRNHVGQELSAVSGNIIENNGAAVADETAQQLAALLQQASFHLFQRIEEAFPCTRLAIAAGGFQDAPVQGSQSIQHFFGNAFQGSKTLDPKVLSSGIEPMGVGKISEKSTGMLRYLDNANGSGKLNENDYGLSVVPSSDVFSKDTGVGMVVDHASQVIDFDRSLENNQISDRDGRHSDGSSDNQIVQPPVPASGTIDLEAIDVEEQCRILKEIRKAGLANYGGSLQARSTIVQSQEKQALKRRKAVNSHDPKSAQLPLSRYFHSSSNG